VHSRRCELKPMTAEDAVLELETSRRDVLVFREARTDRINVIHRQPDGHFEIIDPEP
jgi:putative sigma-54 modulation protein